MLINGRYRSATRGPPLKPRDTSGDVGSLSNCIDGFNSHTGYLIMGCPLGVKDARDSTKVEDMVQFRERVLSNWQGLPWFG